MSVILKNRTESRYEPIVNAIKLEQELTCLLFRDFGLKDIYRFVRQQYNFGKVDTANPHKHIVLLAELKKELRTYMEFLLVNVRIANRIRVNSDMEYHKRLEHQNRSLFYVEMIISSLNKIVEIFNIDINCFKSVVELLYLEQKLINRWIKTDSKKYNG